ncbi:hypothetical protein C8Q76DRAFT_358247 [Earliella scabrosa]|nr:hypothetical protein C8Q76DRAFT_358247 [Earliella scabrosa]
MLEAAHWPLETVKLETALYKQSWRDADKFDRMHPASLLRNARSTLKALECDSWIECSDVLPTYPVYPELQTLNISGVWCPSSAQWVVTYPNLRELIVHTINGHFMDVGEDDLIEHEIHRRLNLDEHSHQTCWKQLESFKGTTLDLYLLGLPCPIRNLSIDLCDDSWRFFEPVINNARPIHLQLSLTQALVCAGTSDVGRCLGFAGLQGLKRLDLSASITLPEHDVRNGHIDQFLRHTLDGMKERTIEEFTFKLLCEKIPYMREVSVDQESASQLPPTPDPPCPIEDWVSHVNVAELARKILASVPSLRVVTLSIQPSSWGDDGWKKSQVRRDKNTGEISHVQLPETA